MSKAASLETRQLTKHFGGIAAVNDISLKVEPREIHGIIGPNGAGKTTLFNLITGIYEPTAGDIIYDGVSLKGIKPHDIAKKGVARTFQNIRLFGELTVYTNVITACQNRINYNLLQCFLKTPKCRAQEKEVKIVAENMLRSLGLWEIRDQTANNLPYGKQRRLEIARALATNPKLLLLDEPAAGMNEEESFQLSKFIKEIRENHDVTIVIIDHHMDVIMDTCDLITVFNFGDKASRRQGH